MTTDFRDVHYYDGKLEEQYTRKRDYTTQEKNILFEQLKNKLSNQNSKNMVNLILSGTQNFDQKNNVDCSDVLADICSTEIDADIFPILEEQLADNFTLGQCPQGRSWRILQIYRSVIQAHKEKEQQEVLDNQRKELDDLLSIEQDEKIRKKIIHYFLSKDPPDRKKLFSILKTDYKSVNELIA